MGAYTLVGAAIALLPLMKPTQAVTHGAFQAIVYVSVVGATGWIGERVFNLLTTKL